MLKWLPNTPATDKRSIVITRVRWCRVLTAHAMLPGPPQTCKTKWQLGSLPDKSRVTEGLRGQLNQKAKPLLIKKWRGRGGPNPLVKHSLLQIFIERPDGFGAPALRSQNGDLALPRCLWRDINRGLALWSFKCLADREKGTRTQARRGVNDQGSALVTCWNAHFHLPGCATFRSILFAEVKKKHFSEAVIHTGEGEKKKKSAALQLQKTFCNVLY